MRWALVAMVVATAASSTGQDTKQIKQLTADQAESLVEKSRRSEEYVLNLDELNELSPEVAKVLAMHAGVLSLDGLATLSGDTSRFLASHKGSLFLNGLTTLSPDVAKSLAQHQGRLWLNGLTTLSDEAAKALSQHQGYLSLNGLTAISEEALAQLRAKDDLVLAENAASVSTQGNSPVDDAGGNETPDVRGVRWLASPADVQKAEGKQPEGDAERLSDGSFSVTYADKIFGRPSSVIYIFSNNCLTSVSVLLFCDDWFEKDVEELWRRIDKLLKEKTMRQVSKGEHDVDGFAREYESPRHTAQLIRFPKGLPNTRQCLVLSYKASPTIPGMAEVQNKQNAANEKQREADKSKL